MHSTLSFGHPARRGPRTGYVTTEVESISWLIVVVRCHVWSFSPGGRAAFRNRLLPSLRSGPGAAGSGVSDLKKTRGEIQKALFVVCRVRVARVSRAVRRDGRSRRGTRTAHRRFPCSPRPRTRPRGRGTASKTSRRSSRASRAPTAGRDIARRAGSSVRLRWRIGTPRKTAWGWWTPHPDGRGTSPQSTARASRPRGEWRGRRARPSASRVLRQAHATFRKLRHERSCFEMGPAPGARRPERLCNFVFGS